VVIAKRVVLTLFILNEIRGLITVGLATKAMGWW
jgi:hypothetical protein